MRRLATALIFAVLVSAPLEAAEFEPGSRVAYFGFTFIDTSTEGAINGAREDETARIRLIEAFVEKELRDRGFELVDLAPVQDKIDRTAKMADCNYCDVLMARELAADYSVVGKVQKVSNLILSMNLVVRDAAEGQHVRGQSVEIRGNTDESWLRGVRYILKNNVFRGE